MRCVAPRAAFYAMPFVTLPPGCTDEDYVLGLLRATGILCVYGSGFGMPAAFGSFRVVFLGDPGELRIDLRRHRYLHPGLSGTRWLTPCLLERTALALHPARPGWHEGLMPRAAQALVAYLLLTMAATWPLTRGLSRDVPWDLGDPLLVMWILAWDCEHLLRLLGGDISRIAGFFDANIFTQRR